MQIIQIRDLSPPKFSIVAFVAIVAIVAIVANVATVAIGRS